MGWSAGTATVYSSVTTSVFVSTPLLQSCILTLKRLTERFVPLLVAVGQSADVAFVDHLREALLHLRQVLAASMHMSATRQEGQTSRFT
jgi:hypothetical protein